MKVKVSLCLAIAAFAGLTAACTHDAAPPTAATHAPVTIAPPVPRGPLTTFGDGKYEVGTAPTDIAPGQYKTSGPFGTTSAGGTDDKKCYWARLKDFTGATTSVKAMQYDVHGPDVVVIEPDDKGFETRACGTWTRVNP